MKPKVKMNDVHRAIADGAPAPFHVFLLPSHAEIPGTILGKLPEVRLIEDFRSLLNAIPAAEKVDFSIFQFVDSTPAGLLPAMMAIIAEYGGTLEAVRGLKGESLSADLQLAALPVVFPETLDALAAEIESREMKGDELAADLALPPPTAGMIEEEDPDEEQADE